MNRNRLDFCVFVAKAMAVLVVIAAFIVVYNFGQVEVLTRNSYIGPSKVMNWPLIFGTIASAIYAVLFAAMMSAVRYACYFAQDASGDGKAKE